MLMEGVGYYHAIFMRHLCLNYSNVFSGKKNHETQQNHEMHSDTEALLYVVMSQVCITQSNSS